MQGRQVKEKHMYVQGMQKVKYKHIQKKETCYIHRESAYKIQSMHGGGKKAKAWQCAGRCVAGVCVVKRWCVQCMVCSAGRQSACGGGAWQ